MRFVLRIKHISLTLPFIIKRLQHMCGIAGIYQPNTDKKRVMDSMLKVIAHRGPDASTQFAHKDTILGHRRLSIIDLATGDQPMFTANRSHCIIYNGELYNFQEIRSELQAKGVLFQTQSDTEVILQAYLLYGSSCLARFNGIFSFAIYDLGTEEIFLARDHFGIKPLHYYQEGSMFLFSSEQKAIIQHPGVTRQLNYQSLHIHLNLRYTQSNETLLRGIKRLPPAHFLLFQKGKIIKIEKYWELKPKIDRSITEGEAIENLHHHLKQAVKRQLISDVPLGVYLSGGLDSSTLVQKMNELGVTDINTFTLGFNEPTDEFPDARRIAEHYHTNHHELSLSLNPLDEYAETIWYAEEPKINLLQGFNMSRFVQPHIKVALGGLGGDELLAGYDIHKFIAPFSRWHRRIPSWLKDLFQWKAHWIYTLQQGTKTLKWDEYRRGMQMLLSIGNIERSYLTIRNVWDFDNGMWEQIYQPAYLKERRQELNIVQSQFQPFFNQVHKLDGLDQVLYVESQTKMINDYLLVEDRMSMSHSIEERVPFLDLDLVNYCFNIPIELKIKHGQTKYLFRKAMENHLPPRIISKKKWGFTVNPYIQFKKDLKLVADEVLSESYIKKQGIFNYTYIRRILDHPPHPRLRWHYNFLWIALGLAYWEDRFL